jgi:hypothetical protein
LEAVPTDTLCEIVENTLRRVINVDLLNAEVAIERDDRRQLDRSRQRVMAVLATI